MGCFHQDVRKRFRIFKHNIPYKSFSLDISTQWMVRAGIKKRKFHQGDTGNYKEGGIKSNTVK